MLVTGILVHDIMSIDIISVPNEVSAQQRHKVPNIMCFLHDIMSIDIISVPNEVSAQQLNINNLIR